MAEALKVVADGQEAVDYLAGHEQFADRRQFPFPSLVLLDLKLPRLDGFEVLKWIRETAGLRDLPVIICTSSAQEDDVRKAYELGANGYVLKPSSGQQRNRLAEATKAFLLRGDPAVLHQWQSLKNA